VLVQGPVMDASRAPPGVNGSGAPEPPGARMSALAIDAKAKIDRTTNRELIRRRRI
jgi:hypothetical protein